MSDLILIGVVGEEIFSSQVMVPSVSLKWHERPLPRKVPMLFKDLPVGTGLYAYEPEAKL